MDMVMHRGIWKPRHLLDLHSEDIGDGDNGNVGHIYRMDDYRDRVQPRGYVRGRRQQGKKVEESAQDQYNFSHAFHKFGQELVQGVRDGVKLAIRDRSGKIGKYGAAFYGNLIGPYDERRADYVVAVRDLRFPTYHIAFVKSHGELITANDVNVDADLKITMTKGERVNVNAFTDLYDNRYEQFGSAKTFPGFRLVQEQKIREGLVEMDLGYEISRRVVDSRTDENGREIIVCRPQAFDLGRGVYLTAQGFFHEPIIGTYRWVVRGVGSILAPLPLIGEVMKGAIDKSLNEEGFVYEQFKRVTGIVSAGFNLPQPQQLKRAA